jgi:hypothetical protein
VVTGPYRELRDLAADEPIREKEAEKDSPTNRGEGDDE